jgi:hypothetical protein
MSPALATAPADDFLVWRADVERKLAARQRGPELIPPVGHPASPSGPDNSIGWWDVTNLDSGGAYVKKWHTWAERITHQSVTVLVPWITEAGTTAQIRIRIQADGGVDIATPPVACIANSSGVQTFKWLHGLARWSTTGAEISVEAITAGANYLHVFIPYGGTFLQVDPRGATPTGV